MAKRKFSRRADPTLMLLAASAAIIVAFFAIISYNSRFAMTIPNPTSNPIMVNLNALNASGESGTALLQEVNGKVTVTLSITGEASGVTEPAHIHVGSCPNPGDAKYPLTSVVNGQSTTTLNVTMAQLKAMGPLAVNVHKSASQMNTFVSCGNLSF